MNWGNFIVIGLVSFIIFIVGSSIYMVSKNNDSLLEDNYYENGLSYDDNYNRKINLIENNATPSIAIEKEYIAITFHTDDNKGTLKFIRNSDKSLDTIVPFYIADDKLKLSTKGLSQGSWIAQIQWESTGVEYEYSQNIVIR